MYYLVDNKQPMKDIEQPPVRHFDDERAVLRYAQNLNSVRVDVVACPDNGEAYIYKRYPINR